MDRVSVRIMVENLMERPIKLHCTDKGKDVEAWVLNFKPKQYMEVSVAAVKITLGYKSNAYVGRLAGLEFYIKEENLPKAMTR